MHVGYSWKVSGNVTKATFVSNHSKRNSQYGFRKGQSSLGAVEDVVSIFYAVQQGNHYTRRIVLLATLDIKNAFNSAN